MQPEVEIRRAKDRFRTQRGWLDAWHCFSYGEHYDPANTHFALLLACNDFLVQPGAGFDPHRHREIEAVTWLLDGSLRHEDDHGHCAVLGPGVAQQMTAGSGIVHAELAANHRPVRFVQMWVQPDARGSAPSYAQHDFGPALDQGGLVVVASGRPEHQAPLRIRQRAATLHVARPPMGRVLDLPDAPYLYVYVARGALDLDGGGALEEGDEARITGVAARRLTTTRPAEVLVWEMHSPPRAS